jgi:6-phosphogluconolactonase
MPAIPFFIGSYSTPSPWASSPGAHGAGIVRAELDPASGAIAIGPGLPEINPSFLVRAPELGLVWGITEPERGGELFACREAAGGRLESLGRVAIGADAPCHLAIDWPRRLALIAHYHGGAVAALMLDAEGRPHERVALARPPYQARGEDRSEASPRPHACLTLQNGELVVTDAGRDLVLLYRLLVGAAQFELLDALPLPRGTGPRHLASSPVKGVFYVSNQNSGGVSLLAREVREGRPKLHYPGHIPAGGLGRDRPVPSEVAVHPKEPVAYLANRRDDSLSVFAIDLTDGRLEPIGAVDVMGRNPRHFAVAPCGHWLVAANQDSDALTVFRIEDQGRRLAWTGALWPIATPTCVAF